MGQAGRIACIFTPYVLSIGALVCLIMVGLGSTSTNSPLNDIYFVRTDLHDIQIDSMDTPQGLMPLLRALQQADGNGDLADFYTFGLWNYCYGDYEDGDYLVKECTERKAQFWFNPAEVWGLDNEVQELFPSTLQKGLDAYRKVAGWLFVAYVIAFVATAVQLIVGISAIFSRWGSFATTICASIAALFTIAASITASVLYGILTGSIKGGLKPFNIDATLGSRMFVLTWFAVLFSAVGGMFWLMSVCCCSGRSPYNHGNRGRRGVVAEKTPYTYERVTDPYGGDNRGSQVPLNPMQPQETAYEPYRHGPTPA